MGSQSVATGGNDQLKAWLRSNVPHVVRELFAGGAAGAVAKTCVAPLERTKILLMTGRSTSSAFNTLRLIVSTEGVGGLFRGNGASCLRIMPYAAIHFSVYESYRRLLAEHLFQPQQSTTGVSATATNTAGPELKSVRGGVATAESLATVGTASSPGSTSRDRSSTASAHSGMHSMALRSPSPRSTDAVAMAAAASLLPHKHLGEDIPPTPMTSSIEVSSTAVITTVEEEQLEDALLAGDDAAPVPPPVVSPPTRCKMDVGSHQHVSDHSALQRRRPGPLVDLVAGSAAGATAVLLTYPLDMVRTRLAWAIDGTSKTVASVGAVQLSLPVASTPRGATAGLSTAGGALAVEPPAHHTRIGAMLVHTARHEGIVGLYRGLAPTLYGIMPYAGLKFFVYGSLKQWYWDTLQPNPPAMAAGKGDHGSGGGHGSSSERLPVPYMLAFGGVSGLLAQTVTYPLDVIRRRMQIFGLQQEAGAVGSSLTAALCSASQPPKPTTSPTQLTTWEVGRKIVLQDGVRGLFRGLSLNYVKVVPSTAIGFTVYDIFKSYLGVTGNI